MQDTNLVVLAGRIISHEIKTFDTGSRVVRYLITVRVEEPRPRVDVLPVNLWVRTDDEEPWLPEERGVRCLVVGAVQRRFWQPENGERRQRIEIIADEVTPLDEERAALRLVALGARLANGNEEE